MKRFARVEIFLDYLAKEEKLEADIFGLRGIKGPLGARWMRKIQEQYAAEREWIRKRLRENRERYGEDITYGSSVVGQDDGFDVTAEDDESDN